MPNDLYTQWLNISPGERPPDHYAMLGLPRLCDDLGMIEGAATHRMETLDKHSLHTDPDKRNACQRMMNEVAQARTLLVNPDRRAEYDLTLPDSSLPAKQESPRPQPDSGPIALRRRRQPLVRLLVGLSTAVIVATTLIWALSPNADQRHQANVDRELSARDFAGARAEAAAIKDAGLAEKLAAKINATETTFKRAAELKEVVEDALANAAVGRVGQATDKFLKARAMCRQWNSPFPREFEDRMLSVLIGAGETKPALPGKALSAKAFRAHFLENAAAELTRADTKIQSLSAAARIATQRDVILLKLQQATEVAHIQRQALGVATQAAAAADGAEHLAEASPHALRAIPPRLPEPLMVPDGNPALDAIWSDAVSEFWTGARSTGKMFQEMVQNVSTECPQCGRPSRGRVS